MSYSSDKPSLLRAVDLWSTAGSPNDAPQTQETFDILDRNQKLLIQNKQLKKQLILQEENADLKTAAVIAQILKSFETISEDKLGKKLVDYYFIAKARIPPTPSLGYCVIPSNYGFYPRIHR
jgi:hypothetical protein